MEVHRNIAGGSRRSRPHVAPFAFALAIFGTCAAASASAADPRPSDVTITVVEDPEQLKEKVNTIKLPDANDVDEGSHAAQKSSRRETTEKDPHAAGEQQYNKAAEGAHEADEKAQSAAESGKSDADDGQQQTAEAHDNESNR